VQRNACYPRLRWVRAGLSLALCCLLRYRQRQVAPPGLYRMSLRSPKKAHGPAAHPPSLRRPAARVRGLHAPPAAAWSASSCAAGPDGLEPQALLRGIEPVRTSPLFLTSPVPYGLRSSPDGHASALCRRFFGRCPWIPPRSLRIVIVLPSPKRAGQVAATGARGCGRSGPRFVSLAAACCRGLSHAPPDQVSRVR